MIMIMKNKYVVVLHNTGNFGVEKVIGTFSSMDKAHDYCLEDRECQKDYLYHIYKLEEVEIEEDTLTEDAYIENTFDDIFQQAEDQHKKENSNSMSWRQSLANDLHDLAYHIASPKADTAKVLEHAVTSLKGVVQWAQGLQDGKT